MSQSEEPAVTVFHFHPSEPVTIPLSSDLFSQHGSLSKTLIEVHSDSPHSNNTHNIDNPNNNDDANTTSSTNPSLNLVGFPYTNPNRPYNEEAQRERGGPGELLVSANSLPEAFASVPISIDASKWQKFKAFSGIGLMISVGYMDPGNWQTDLSGGVSYNFQLLFIILISNFMAILLQHLALKLGIATQKDLAQACRDGYPKYVSVSLWILCEIAIVSCDLAEVLGTAVAINILFSIPLYAGCLITALDVFIILILGSKSYRSLELLVSLIVVSIFIIFTYQLSVAHVDWNQVGWGCLPSKSVFSNTAELFIAVGILGATIMPHNLYLHSSIVQTRAYPRNKEGKQMAISYCSWDSAASLCIASIINMSILIVSASAFYNTSTGSNVAELADAAHLMDEALGATGASTLFAVGLLLSGQNATLTGTLAGQIVGEGFVDFSIRPWLRRLVTRSVAIVPACIVAAIYGPTGVSNLLILSQVILSLQLSFAVVPLVSFTSDVNKMGPDFVNGALIKVISWTVALIIALVNVFLIITTFWSPPGTN